MASVLAASPELSDMHREHLSVIQDSGTDLLTLISDILDQARLDSKQVVLDPAPFVLRDVMDGVLHSMASVAQNKGLELCLLNSLGDDPPLLLADSFRVKQVGFQLWISEAKSPGSTQLPVKRHQVPRVGKVTVQWNWEVRDDLVDISIDVVDTVSDFLHIGQI